MRRVSRLRRLRLRLGFGGGCLAAVVILLGAGGCEPLELTGVELTVRAPMEADQLRISGNVAGEQVLAETSLPEVPRKLALTGESLFIVTDEELGGKSLELQLMALLNGNRVGVGFTKVLLVARRIVPSGVELIAPGVCGDGALNQIDEQCDDQNIDRGDGCSETCQIEEGFGCRTPDEGPSFCEPFCSGQLCGEGARCVDGSCVCDGTSCPGCCDGARCRLETTTRSCGALGRACQICDPLLADTCLPTGQCGCGAASQCDPGQLCREGDCLCDAQSCDGCCDGAGRCQTELSLWYCGPVGGSCQACDDRASDGCLPSGECGCGSRPACLSGQHCVDGGCVCDAVACQGCCQGNVCLEGNTPAACGASGAACAACAEGDGCVDGACSGCQEDCSGCCVGPRCVEPATAVECGIGGSACQACPDRTADGCRESGLCGCGNGPVCAEGQHCVDGACVCNEASCPDGCCLGASCRPGNQLTVCGAGGQACVTCGLGSDTCLPGGQCSCGGGPPCGPGQRCAAAGCVCDARSCPDGCCQGGRCLEGTTVAACGTGGEDCQECGAGQACTPAGRDCRCDPVACATGCCDAATEACLPGTSEDACGWAGRPCQSCTTGTCAAGVCEDLCADLCLGCCSGAACVLLADQTDLVCGSGGVRCENCVASEHTCDQRPGLHRCR